IPALLTRMSRRPCFSTTAPGTFSSAARSVTSTPIASARPPRSVIAAAVAAALSPRATATIVAPCCAKRSAIARPIPRDAPVTTATLPVRSNTQRLDRRNILRRSDVCNLRLAVDAAHHAAQNCPRTNLNIRCDALGRKTTDDVFPPDWRRHLRDQGFDRVSPCPLRLRVDIGPNGHAGIVSVE